MPEILLDISLGVIVTYAFVNGFHDGANVVATIISSRSMHPYRALALAAVSEFVGAVILGTAVAQTMAGSILTVELFGMLTPQHIYAIAIGAASAAIAWNIGTWFLGLPSSSSHALVGGLIGAGWMAMGVDGIATHKVVQKVLLPLLLTPIVSIVTGFLFYSAISHLLGGANRAIGRLFSFLQKPSMILLAATHGSNDAQKSMGIVAFVLLAGNTHVGGGMSIPEWAVIACSGALALGLSAGGWRIVKTVGYGICKLEAVHSFASQMSAAFVIFGSSELGWPVSTAQVVASSVMGVGAARRISGVRWVAAANIGYAWFLTVPVSGCLGALGFWCITRILVV